DGPGQGARDGPGRDQGECVLGVLGDPVRARCGLRLLGHGAVGAGVTAAVAVVAAVAVPVAAVAPVAVAVAVAVVVA
ncbi:hypothetical protein QN416_24210, partial [Glaciimonas sp. Cout2]|uniref:hypothetical protein n=1 Tax=Glaciimonas sp. Cout2 TaxID=3048621 RepID=UPI002B2350A8